MTAITGLQTNQKSLAVKLLLPVVLLLYILIAAYTMAHHEPWGDELHSWNLAKNSSSIAELMRNRLYEGHPPVWYLVLWTIAQATHDPAWMQWIHLGVATLTVSLLLFRAPFPIMVRVLLPFGYYFLFEYAVLSRNYAIGILACFLLCIVLRKNFRYKPLLYYGLLLLMSNTHLLALILAGCLHLYFLMDLAERKARRGVLLLHVALGVLILLPAVYFIIPPSDTDLGLAASMKRWTFDRLLISVQAPLRAFVPMPAWWKYQFWNWQCILELNAQYKAMKVISLLLVVGLVWLAFYLLKGSRKSQALFGVNVALTFMAGLIYPLGTQRYAGFIFIGFIAAYWLYSYQRPRSPFKAGLLIVLLTIQGIAGIFTVSRDIRFPFSNFYRIGELLDKVPEGEPVVTEYWTLIAGSAYKDRSFYCIDLQREHSFIRWDADMAAMTRNPYRYCDGLKALFEKQGRKQVYFFSASSPQVLKSVDARLFTAFRVELVSKTSGAIERWSDLYLYRISSL